MLAIFSVPLIAQETAFIFSHGVVCDTTWSQAVAIMMFLQPTKPCWNWCIFWTDCVKDHTFFLRYVFFLASEQQQSSWVDFFIVVSWCVCVCVFSFFLTYILTWSLPYIYTWSDINKLLVDVCLSILSVPVFFYHIAQEERMNSHRLVAPFITHYKELQIIVCHMLEQLRLHIVISGLMAAP